MKNISEKSNNFWEKYSKSIKSDNSLMNLESDEKVASEKFTLEKQHLEKTLQFNNSDIIVDLGAGIGLWSEYFSKKVNKIYLVEKQEEFINKAKERVKKISLNNIDVIHSDVLDFELQENSVDYVFLSGVTIYLDNELLNSLINKIYKYLKPNGKLIHRDAYGIDELYLVNNFSEALGMQYNAIYRTKAEYDGYFLENCNFKKIYDQDMYEGGNSSPYNKWKETRLRLALYQK